MATLRGLRAHFTIAETARIYQDHGLDYTEGRVREAERPRAGRSGEAARLKRREMDKAGKSINLRKQIREGPPGPGVVSAKVISSPVKTKTVRGMVSVQAGYYPHIDRANDVETWSKPRRALHRESLERLITEAQRQFNGDLVRVVIYGRFMAHRGKYRLSARGGNLGWREDRFAINTHAHVLEQLLHEVNRDITREMNVVGTARERRWIQDGDPNNDEQYPAPSARWATKLTASMEHPTAEYWSEVNWVLVQRVLPTIKSQM